MMKVRAYGSKAFWDDKFTWCFHKIKLKLVIVAGTPRRLYFRKNSIGHEDSGVDLGSPLKVSQENLSQGRVQMFCNSSDCVFNLIKLQN